MITELGKMIQEEPDTPLEEEQSILRVVLLQCTCSKGSHRPKERENKEQSNKVIGLHNSSNKSKPQAVPGTQQQVLIVYVPYASLSTTRVLLQACMTFLVL